MICNCFGEYPYRGFTDSHGCGISGAFNGVREINSAIEMKRQPSESVLEYASNGRFKTLKEWGDNVFPTKPASIVEFCKFFNIFKDEKTVHKLIPSVYTYWS